MTGVEGVAFFGSSGLGSVTVFGFGAGAFFGCAGWGLAAFGLVVAGFSGAFFAGATTLGFWGGFGASSFFGGAGGLGRSTTGGLPILMSAIFSSASEVNGLSGCLIKES